MYTVAKTDDSGRLPCAGVSVWSEGFQVPIKAATDAPPLYPLPATSVPWHPNHTQLQCPKQQKRGEVGGRGEG